MKHLLPRRGISFLEQVPHRSAPASLDVALSHPGARSIDALRHDGHVRKILLKLGASVYGPDNRGLRTKPPSYPDNCLRYHHSP
jgi:hypothetical protein